uniref:Uncharacterized protein n=1 Tax=Arundo donax TaxID=35708 RepID=A0A0A8XQ03_ARUDO
MVLSSLCPDQASPSVISLSRQSIRKEKGKLYLIKRQIHYSQIGGKIRNEPHHIFLHFSQNPVFLGMT